MHQGYSARDASMPTALLPDALPPALRLPIRLPAAARLLAESDGRNSQLINNDGPKVQRETSETILEVFCERCDRRVTFHEVNTP